MFLLMIIFCLSVVENGLQDEGELDNEEGYYISFSKI